MTIRFKFAVGENENFPELKDVSQLKLVNSLLITVILKCKRLKGACYSQCACACACAGVEVNTQAYEVSSESAPSSSSAFEGKRPGNKT